METDSLVVAKPEQPETLRQNAVVPIIFERDPACTDRAVLPHASSAPAAGF